jgi:hypothetical protein
MCLNTYLQATKATKNAVPATLNMSSCSSVPLASICIDTLVNKHKATIDGMIGLGSNEVVSDRWVANDVKL